MSNKDFIKRKLNLMEKDSQDGFKDFIEPLNNMADNQDTNKTVEIKADGNWFTLNFKAIQVKENRLVISAKRAKDGLSASRYNPSEKEYIVEFQGTRAAYIRGYYKEKHPLAGWPFMWWDVRSYTNHPNNDAIRTYVQGFYAHQEIKKLILSMEQEYGVSNILNSYINDNLLRLQLGIKSGKTPQEIEKEWSKGMMESLGYQHVEAFDTGHPKGGWKEAKSHWCKKKNDLRPNL